MIAIQEVSLDNRTPLIFEAPRVFDVDLSSIHALYGLDYPLDGEPLGEYMKSLDRLQQRMVSLSGVRREIYKTIGGTFGEEAEITHAAYIVAEIGDDFDAIFLGQLQQKGLPPRSWRGYSAEHAQHLEQTIDQITRQSDLQDYFEGNPQTRDMLAIVANLASTDSLDGLERIQLDLEELAIAQWQERKPVVLMLLSAWYMYPNLKSGEQIKLLEPDCRLLLPPDEAQYRGIAARVDNDIRLISPFFPAPNWSTKPVGIEAPVLMQAGCQPISYTIGEALNHHGYTFSPNIVKNDVLIRDTFARADLDIPSNLSEITRKLFARHELSHTFYATDPFLAEIIADCPTVATTLFEALEQGDRELSSVIAIIVSEYRMYAHLESNGEANNDGYRIACIAILNALWKHGLIVLDEEKLFVNPDRSRCLRLIDELTALQKEIITNEAITIDRMRSIEPADGVRQLISFGTV